MNISPIQERVRDEVWKRTWDKVDDQIPWQTGFRVREEVWVGTL